eukprot:Rhum_TRINITY_DN14806_c22_g1::Rhum_TRINITY_DN14806_c22_g1_i1::g.120213::m.120213
MHLQRQHHRVLRLDEREAVDCLDHVFERDVRRARVAVCHHRQAVAAVPHVNLDAATPAQKRILIHQDGGLTGDLVAGQVGVVAAEDCVAVKRVGHVLVHSVAAVVPPPVVRRREIPAEALELEAVVLAHDLARGRNFHVVSLHRSQELVELVELQRVHHRHVAFVRRRQLREDRLALCPLTQLVVEALEVVELQHPVFVVVKLLEARLEHVPGDVHVQHPQQRLRLHLCQVPGCVRVALPEELDGARPTLRQRLDPRLLVLVRLAELPHHSLDVGHLRPTRRRHCLDQHVYPVRERHRRRREQPQRLLQLHDELFRPLPRHRRRQLAVEDVPRAADQRQRLLRHLQGASRLLRRRDAAHLRVRRPRAVVVAARAAHAQLRLERVGHLDGADRLEKHVHLLPLVVALLLLPPRRHRLRRHAVLAHRQLPPRRRSRCGHHAAAVQAVLAVRRAQLRRRPHQLRPLPERRRPVARVARRAGSAAAASGGRRCSGADAADALARLRRENGLRDGETRAVRPRARRAAAAHRGGHRVDGGAGAVAAPERGGVCVEDGAVGAQVVQQRALEVLVLVLRRRRRRRRRRPGPRRSSGVAAGAGAGASASTAVVL